jgi:hypothetical protein
VPCQAPGQIRSRHLASPFKPSTRRWPVPQPSTKLNQVEQCQDSRGSGVADVSRSSNLTRPAFRDTLYDPRRLIPLPLPFFDAPGHALLQLQANIAYQDPNHGVGNSLPTRGPWALRSTFTNSQRCGHDPARQRPHSQRLAKPTQRAAAIAARPVFTHQPESRQISFRTTSPPSRVAANEVAAAVIPVLALDAAHHGRRGSSCSACACPRRRPGLVAHHPEWPEQPLALDLDPTGPAQSQRRVEPAQRGL